MVIFDSQQAGKHVLAMVSLDGKVRLRLPARKGIVQDPAWGPLA
jgi:TolB protein